MHLNNDVKRLKEKRMPWTKTNQQNPKLALNEIEVLGFAWDEQKPLDQHEYNQ